MMTMMTGDDNVDIDRYDICPNLCYQTIFIYLTTIGQHAPIHLWLGQGTECSNYPACRAAGITTGHCCPNPKRLRDCRMSFFEEVTISKQLEHIGTWFELSKLIQIGKMTQFRMSWPFKRPVVCLSNWALFRICQCFWHHFFDIGDGTFGDKPTVLWSSQQSACRYEPRLQPIGRFWGKTSKPWVH